MRFSKEGNHGICNTMSEPRGHDTESSKPVTKGQITHEATYMRNRK